MAGDARLERAVLQVETESLIQFGQSPLKVPFRGTTPPKLAVPPLPFGTSDSLIGEYVAGLSNLMWAILPPICPHAEH
jgi:hypothetical protein